jgi:NADPH-dependent glutamate synthase beta subunit-like oxidoreductase/NAD-dependent dihydropyrimidine dehydrogenase PreA subunit
LIREGRFLEARQVVRESIPFSAVCGYACLHPCEARCARIQFDEPLAIRMLKLAAEKEGGHTPDLPPSPLPDPGKKIAIVGAGPCGLAAGYYLARLGHQPVVFEARPEAGGLLRYGIPAYRLPRQALQEEIELIRAQGVEIITSRPVRRPVGLLAEGFAAVLVAVGTWQSLPLGIAAENAPQVINGLVWLQQINGGRLSSLAGKQVIVIGGGNTAIDTARSARRLGAEVLIVYRRREEDMPASPEEIEDAREEGVLLETLAAPLGINGSLVTFTRMDLGNLDASGRPTPIPRPGSEFELKADLVVAAIGQKGSGEIMGLKATAGGRILVDGDTHLTQLPGVFAAGDAVLGPSSIIAAIGEAKKAAAAMHRYLGGSQPALREGPSPEDMPPPPAARGTGRVERAKIPVAKRILDFSPVELVLGAPVASAEAGRCLACDSRDFAVHIDAELCKECGYCREVCSLGVFQATEAFNRQGYRPTAVVADAFCVGCRRCVYVCPDFAISVNEGQRKCDQALINLPG